MNYLNSTFNYLSVKDRVTYKSEVLPTKNRQTLLKNILADKKLIHQKDLRVLKRSNVLIKLLTLCDDVLM